MTDNTTTKGEADTESEAELLTFNSPDEDADLDAELTGVEDNLTDDQAETGEGAPRGDGSLGTGALTGAFGFAGLALGIVSLTTNWTSSVMVSHSEYTKEVNAGSSGLPLQQSLNMYTSGWTTEGWWALIFAGAAVLFGCGALLLPTFLRRRDAPAWANAAATGAMIVGLVGVLLAVLTILGVFGGHMTAPTTAG